MVVCNLICAGVNEATLFVTIFLVPLLIIGLLLKLANGAGLHGVTQLIMLSFGLFGCSFFGLVPWYITVIVIGYTVYSTAQRRSEGRPLNA